MSLTPSQQRAVETRGNVLVMAGAGTGKTRTLVERCLSCLLDERESASIDEILMVTFTEAAAAEMRHRIRLRLEEEQRRHPDEPRWAEELAVFEMAHIGTLHSFCLQLVRQHFWELQLDPQLTVLAEEDARLIAEETLDDLLEKQYSGRSKTAEAVQELLQVQGRGMDRPIRSLVLRLHRYAQTQPEPEGWFAQQLSMFGETRPAKWEEWLEKGAEEWRASWHERLGEQAGRNPCAAKCQQALARPFGSRRELAGSLERVSAAFQDCPRGKKTEWIKPLEELQRDAEFLFSLAAGEPGGREPLVEDWDWVRGQMRTLLELAQEFTKTFTETKRELGVVDFHDLEQYALRLLWDARSGEPTGVAREWQQKLRFVFVDEYQDINAAQDRIIEALSRPGKEANRFLVGDVKQSIYRFRLADPHIFQAYAAAWRGNTGQTVTLSENFRSREGILRFVNSIFSRSMRGHLGGVEYDEAARLGFGAPEKRQALSVKGASTLPVELRLRVKGAGNGGEEPAAEDGKAALQELEEAEKEARMVARCLREMKAKGEEVWDETGERFRPVEWKDMAILLRAPSGKAESYAKEFARAGDTAAG